MCDEVVPNELILDTQAYDHNESAVMSSLMRFLYSYIGCLDGDQSESVAFRIGGF